MTIICHDFSGSESAQALTTVSVPDRYLVVRLVILGAPVYIHNVYAPANPAERILFFDQLRTGTFDHNATHIVCGDLNTTLCPSLDCSSGVYRHEISRLSCLEWLSKLGVLDAWRQHHPEARIFTGPQHRKKRLNYILLSEPLFQSVYKESSYVSLPHTGDHLAHVVKFANPSQLQGRGYWKCPLSLFDYPVIKEAIEEEAYRILGKLLVYSHPGTDWENWKKQTKNLLQQVQKRIRLQCVKRSCSSLSTIKSRNRKKVYAEDLRSNHDRVRSSSKYNQDSMFDYHMKNMEKSSHYFFRPVDSTCHPVPLEVLLPNGKVSLNPIDITLQFTDHWGGIMENQQIQLDLLCVHARQNNIHCFNRSQKPYPALTNLFCPPNY